MLINASFSKKAGKEFCAEALLKKIFFGGGGGGGGGGTLRLIIICNPCSSPIETVFPDTDNIL